MESFMPLMKAAFLTAPHKIEIREIPAPAPRDDEILVRVTHVGVCGSDVHYWSDGKIGHMNCPFPFILGHEAAGVVAAMGRNVKGWKEGRRVAVDPAATCGKCRQCLEGRQNLCPSVRFLGSPPDHGAYCEYLTATPERLLPIPEHMTQEEAAPKHTTRLRTDVQNPRVEII